ncbi:conserved hypothetical protein [Trichinella spiralis]|uniref:hypothetical protein n=1 Tax=Trichinella spiralis TaxID=6334 RepID=UPI0001EFD8CA|nr:conserved hypothetical protein [Trichinella spiralis]
MYDSGKSFDALMHTEIHHNIKTCGRNQQADFSCGNVKLARIAIVVFRHKVVLNLSSLWRSSSKFLMLTLKEKILISATSPLLICDGPATILRVQRSLLHLAAQYIF